MCLKIELTQGAKFRHCKVSRCVSILAHENALVLKLRNKRK